jgi:hypothetical protein
MSLLTIAFIATFAVAALAFVGGAMLWLKHLRTHMANAMRETLNRQINHGQKVEEALNLLQRAQKQMETQVRTLAEAQGRARTDINLLRDRVEQREVAAESQPNPGRVIH